VSNNRTNLLQSGYLCQSLEPHDEDDRSAGPNIQPILNLGFTQICLTELRMSF